MAGRKKKQQKINKDPKQLPEPNQPVQISHITLRQSGVSPSDHFKLCSTLNRAVAYLGLLDIVIVAATALIEQLQPISNQPEQKRIVCVRGILIK